MQVYVPAHLDAKTLYGVMSQVMDDLGELRSNRFAFDLRKLVSITPVGVVTLSNLVEWLRMRGASCAFSFPSLAAGDAATRMLAASGFLHLYGDGPGPDAFHMDPHVLSLRRLKPHAGIAWLEECLNPWIARTTRRPLSFIADATRVVREVFSNTSRHAGPVPVLLLARYESDENCIRLVASDCGTGIPNTVRAFHARPLNDAAALLYAVEKGYTPGKPPVNGLARLAHTVTFQGGGQLSLVAGRGCVRCYQSEGRYILQPRMTHALYPGTLCEIMLNTRALSPVLQLNEPASHPQYVAEQALFERFALAGGLG